MAPPPSDLVANTVAPSPEQATPLQAPDGTCAVPKPFAETVCDSKSRSSASWISAAPLFVETFKRKAPKPALLVARQKRVSLRLTNEPLPAPHVVQFVPPLLLPCNVQMRGSRVAK